ncbi:hypothetical protein OWV82_001554 [Melia azedarach]|uniref:Uncharacterized protein n=1 Tax=Melia azedarach TaxID=155640 RepID=A0ACC1YZW8_MELAZ|nr:hypothetical protein OWV82_001554 [Melia azedarach]
MQMTAREYVEAMSDDWQRKIMARDYVEAVFDDWRRKVSAIVRKTAREYVVAVSDDGRQQHSPADSEATTLGNVASSPISSSRTKGYKVRAGRGHSNVIGESSEEGAGQSFFLGDEGTSVTVEMLAQLRKTYDIPSSVKLSLPRQGFRPSRLGSNEALSLLLRMSMSSCLDHSPEEAWLYYLRTYTGQPHLVPQVNPNTTDKAWDDFWFVVSGDWGQTMVEDGETYIVPNQFKWAGKWTRDLSRDTDIKSVREYMATNPSETNIVTEERLARTPQLAVDLGGVLGGHFAHASQALPTLKQVLEFSNSEKGSEVAGLNPNQAIDMASHLFLQGSFLVSQFGDKLKEGSTSTGRVAKLETQLSRLSQKVDRANELQANADKLEIEASSNLLHGYHYMQYQVTREYLDLDLHYMDFGFDRDALVAKFGKNQNPADAAGSSRQLTSGHPLNLEVFPPHSDQKEDDSENQMMKDLSRGRAMMLDLTLNLCLYYPFVGSSFLPHFSLSFFFL